MSSTDSSRDVGLQHEPIRLVVTCCTLLPHISSLLSTLFCCIGPEDSALAYHEPLALLAPAAASLCSPARLLRIYPVAILAEIRGHLPHLLPRILLYFDLLTIAKTIYIYLGVASLTGISCGLLLHFVYSFLHSNLHLASEPAVKGPTLKQYRASRKPKEAMLSPTLSMSSVLDTPAAGRYGLLAQTIHEEDSDF